MALQELLVTRDTVELSRNRRERAGTLIVQAVETKTLLGPQFIYHHFFTLISLLCPLSR